MANPAVGVNWHATWSGYTDVKRIQILDLMQAAKMTTVRIDIPWYLLEPTASGQHDVTWTNLIDGWVNMANARGLRPLLMVDQPPAWAQPAGSVANTPPASNATYATFMGWAAGHWAGRVDWEIWNEPNQAGFWTNPNAANYAALVKAAYPAIKAADPTALVVAGSVSLNDVPFLQGMYAAGVKGFFDVLSTHPYPQPSDNAPTLADDGTIYTYRHVEAVRALMVAQNDPKPIWFTEVGWSTHTNTGTEANWMRGVTEQTQATYSVAAVQTVAANYPYVTNIQFYTEADLTYADVQNNNYGLLHVDLSVKPAYTALKNYLVNLAVSVVGAAKLATATVTKAYYGRLAIPQMFLGGTALLPVTPPAGFVKPSATNTGVPAGTVLTTRAGDVTVTVAGTVLDALDIAGRVIVKAANVSITRCRIRGQGSPAANTALVDATNGAVASLLVQDCTLAMDVATVWVNGVNGHDFTMRRCNVSNIVDGCGLYDTFAPGTALNVLIESNWIHSLAYISPDQNHSDNQTHADTVQIQGGTGAIIRGNFLDAYFGNGAGTTAQPLPTASPSPSGATNVEISCLMFNNNVGNTSGHSIEDNWDGGGRIPYNCAGAAGMNLGHMWRNSFDRGSLGPAPQQTILLAASQTADTGDSTPNQNVFTDLTPVTVRHNG